MMKQQSNKNNKNPSAMIIHQPTQRQCHPRHLPSILTLFTLLLTILASPASCQEEVLLSPKDHPTPKITDGNNPLTPPIDVHPTKPSTEQTKRTQTIESLFFQTDTNHDSTLSLSEFTLNFQQISSASSSHSFGGGVNLDGLDSGFWNGFSSSTMMIIATEIGDKTFFIAAVLSMRNSRFTIFMGSFLALVCMTVLSTLIGLILPSLLPQSYTHIIASILFFYFGIKLIYDSRGMDDKVSDELEEVEEELLATRKKEDSEVRSSAGDVESETNGAENTSPAVSGEAVQSSSSGGAASIGKGVFFQAFLLTFLAEWGDRSQIATIALAADKDPVGVTVGACFGHGLCTGMACVGGRMLASRIKERTVSFWGGVVFLGFGAHSAFWDE